MFAISSARVTGGRSMCMGFLRVGWPGNTDAFGQPTQDAACARPIQYAMRSGHEAEVAAAVCREPAKVREDVGDCAAVDAEPARERGGVLVDRGGRDDLAVAGVVRIAVRRQRRQRAVEALAMHRAAEHEVVAAPAVVGDGTVDRERAAEIRRGERGNDALDAELHGRGMERMKRLEKLV